MPFGSNAIGGLLQDMEAVKRRMQGPLTPPPGAFQIPQAGGLLAPPPGGAPAPMPSPPLAPPPNAFANIANANISDPNDLSYQYRPGIRGAALRLLGADRVAPELQALLTPDQIKRVKPGVVGSLWNAINYGVGPQTVMQARAKNMLNLQDKKTGRDKSAALAQLQAAWTPAIFAARTPEEIHQAQTGYANARAAIIGPEAMGTTPNFLESLEPRAEKEYAPQRETWARENGVVNGTPMQYQLSNLGNVRDMAGNPFPANTTFAPSYPPVQSSYAVPSGLVTPTGSAPVLNTKTGEWEDSGLVKADSGTGPSSDDKFLAAQEADRSYSNLLDDSGGIKEPPSGWDRLVTKSDWTNPLASEEGQAYMNNVRSLIRSWAIVVEGKRMSDADARVNEILKSFRFGNKGKADQQTKDRLKGMAREIKQKMGNGGGGGKKYASHSQLSDAQLNEAARAGATTEQAILDYWNKK